MEGKTLVFGDKCEEFTGDRTNKNENVQNYEMINNDDSSDDVHQPASPELMSKEFASTGDLHIEEASLPIGRKSSVSQKLPFEKETSNDNSNLETMATEQSFTEEIKDSNGSPVNQQNSDTNDNFETKPEALIRKDLEEFTTPKSSSGPEITQVMEIEPSVHGDLQIHHDISEPALKQPTANNGVISGQASYEHLIPNSPSKQQTTDSGVILGQAAYEHLVLDSPSKQLCGFSSLNIKDKVKSEELSEFIEAEAAGSIKRDKIPDIPEANQRLQEMSKKKTEAKNSLSKYENPDNSNGMIEATAAGTKSDKIPDTPDTESFIVGLQEKPKKTIEAKTRLSESENSEDSTASSPKPRRSRNVKSRKDLLREDYPMTRSRSRELQQMASLDKNDQNSEHSKSSTVKPKRRV